MKTDMFVVIIWFNEARTDFLVFGPYAGYESADAKADGICKRFTARAIVASCITKLFPE